VCVVMASAGYPGDYEKGKPIRGLDEAARIPDSKVFHAGTMQAADQVLSDGGRVLGVTALGDSLRQAQRAAYSAISAIHFDGMQYRRDIGHRALARRNGA